MKKCRKTKVDTEFSVPTAMAIITGLLQDSSDLWELKQEINGDYSAEDKRAANRKLKDAKAAITGLSVHIKQVTLTAAEKETVLAALQLAMDFEETYYTLAPHKGEKETDYNKGNSAKQAQRMRIACRLQKKLAYK